MKKERTKKEIETEIGLLRKELNDIEYKEVMEKHVPYLLSLVGKSYVYRDNSYGGDEKDRHWDVYKRILDAVQDKEGYVHYIVEEFSVDCYGKLNYSIESDYVYHDGREPFNSGYVECPLTEYMQKHAEFWEEGRAFTKIRKYLKKK